MSGNTSGLGELVTLSKRLVKQVLAMGHGRVELLLVEIQEERERLVLAFLLAIGAAAFGLLAGIVLTVLLVVLAWEYSRVGTLVVLLLTYATTAFFLYSRLMKLQKEWKTLPATTDQFQKDRTCLEQILN